MSTSSVQKSHSILSRRRLALAGVAAFVGCAACCAIPLVAAAGLGGAGAATLSWLFRPGSELVVGVAVFLSTLGVMAARGWLRRGGRAAGGPATTTSESPSCGCGGCTSRDEPVVCTLEGREQQQARAADFREVFGSLERAERLDGSARWYFRDEPGLETRLRELARREHECCRFLEFRVAREGGALVWETRAPEHASSVLEEFMRLPEALGRGPTPVGTQRGRMR